MDKGPKSNGCGKCNHALHPSSPLEAGVENTNPSTASVNFVDADSVNFSFGLEKNLAAAYCGSKPLTKAIELGFLDVKP
jgi:hypothetical protein